MNVFIKAFGKATYFTSYCRYRLGYFIRRVGYSIMRMIFFIEGLCKKP